jgi:hypothetical protein
VEAVPAHTLLVERFRDGKAVGHLRVPAMEGRVEAGGLQDLGLHGTDRPDRQEVVRLVQRCERDQGFQIGDHVIVDGHVRIVGRTAVHDTMADRNRKCPALVSPQPAPQMAERRPSIRQIGRGKTLLGDHLLPRVPGDQAGVGADALDLSPQVQIETVGITGDLEELELEARRAGVGD